MRKSLALARGRFGRAAILEMRSSLVLHAHACAHVIFSLDARPARFQVLDRVHSLDQDAMIVVNSWEPHAYSHAGADLRVVLALYIEPGWLQSVTGSARLTGQRIPVTLCMARLLSHIETEVLHAAAAEPNELERFVRELVGDLVIAPGPSACERPRIFDHRIRRAVELIATSFEERLSMANIARMCGLSRDHFFARFHAETNMTPCVFRNMLRMDAARAALTNEDKRLSEIALDLGFAAQGNFTRFFVQNQGVTPTIYRRAAASAWLERNPDGRHPF